MAVTGRGPRPPPARGWHRHRLANDTAPARRAAVTRASVSPSPGTQPVPYTSYGDPGHRVDFARPAILLFSEVAALLGPLWHGA